MKSILEYVQTIFDYIYNREFYTEITEIPGIVIRTIGNIDH